MTINNQKDILGLLRNGIFRDYQQVDHVVNALDVMASNLHAIVGERGSVFPSIVQNMRTHLSGSRYNFLEYFQGNGAVARRLREHMAVQAWAQGSDEVSEATEQMQKLLKRFDYKPSDDVGRLKALNDFVIAHVVPLVNGEKKYYPVEQIKTDLVLSELKTGFFVDERPHLPRRELLVLSGTIPGSDAKCLLLAISGMDIQIYYFHPEEDVWIYADQKHTLHGALMTLTDEWNKAIADLQEAHRLQEQPKDWAQEFALLEERANLIFDQEHYLPAKTQAYTRCDLTSTIELLEAGYLLTYRSTRGVYPSKSFSLTKKHGNLELVVKLSELDEQLKRKMLKYASYCLSNLEEELLENQKQHQAASQNEGTEHVGTEQSGVTTQLSHH